MSKSVYTAPKARIWDVYGKDIITTSPPDDTNTDTYPDDIEGELNP